VYDSGLLYVGNRILDAIRARGLHCHSDLCDRAKFTVLDLDREFRKLAGLVLDTVAGCSVEFPCVMMAG
jgi:hypothetical protein